MNRTGHSSPSSLVHSVTRLVRAFENFERFTAVLEHLRHEWHAIKSALFVERPQDFFLASDLDPISCSQPVHDTSDSMLLVTPIHERVSCHCWGNDNDGARSPVSYCGMDLPIKDLTRSR